MKREVRDKREKLYEEWTGLDRINTLDGEVTYKQCRKIKKIQNEKFKKYDFLKGLMIANDKIKNKQD